MPVGASVASAGLNFAGGAMDRRAAKGQASKANRRNSLQIGRAMEMSQEGYQNAQNGITEGYGRAGDIQQENLNRNLGLLGESYMPQAQQYQSANMAAQQAYIDSLPQMRSAILGGKMPQTMSAYSVPIDESGLQGIINPRAQQFPTTQKFADIRGPK